MQKCFFTTKVLWLSSHRQGVHPDLTRRRHSHAPLLLLCPSSVSTWFSLAKASPRPCWLSAHRDLSFSGTSQMQGRSMHDRDWSDSKADIIALPSFVQLMKVGISQGTDHSPPLDAPRASLCQSRTTSALVRTRGGLRKTSTSPFPRHQPRITSRIFASKHVFVAMGHFSTSIAPAPISVVLKLLSHLSQTSFRRGSLKPAPTTW
jgi:hypothetical protein